MHNLPQSILNHVGRTPLITIKMKDLPEINLYAKLEYYNPTGSIKDRAADYILKKGLENKTINKDTTIIESSSGNFGISLAAYCKKNGIKFICVIDPNISPINEMLIKHFEAEIIKVKEQDEYGGYLINRIKKVKELLNKIENSYWVNQYSNPLNAEAYHQSLGNEICSEFTENLDYVFLGVSSGGTITGVSQSIKKKYPNAKIIAVDVYGSVIFGNPPHKRHIPGIGSSMVPDILKYAFIDDVVLVDELETINHCKKLLGDHCIFAGGSSGSVYAAIHKFFRDKVDLININVLTIFPDRGERYSNTIYCENWYTDSIKKKVMVPKIVGDL
jgi:cysteine synthase A